MYNGKFTVAIIAAAGSGRRMNSDLNKIWLKINNEVILSHTLKVFEKLTCFDLIVIVAPKDEIPRFEAFLNQQCPKFRTPISIVVGGQERQDSVANGLQFIERYTDNAVIETGLVVIHDAARMLVTSEEVVRAIAAGLEFGAAGVGTPVKDTIKQVNGEGFVVATPDRTTLWAIQTPQVFDFKLLVDCYRRVKGVNKNFSDDCGVVEYCGHPVKLILGSYENIKITTPEDLVIAETILRGRINANRAGV